MKNKKEKRYAILAIFLLVIATSGGVYTYTQLHNQHATLLPSLSTGLTLVYRFLTISSNNNSRSLQAGTVANDTFHLDVKGNYQRVLDQYNRSDAYVVNRTSDCEIASNALYLTIHITTFRSDMMSANVTLTFVNGTANCGPEFGQLPRIDGRWMLESWTYVSSFRQLNFTRTIIIDYTNSDSRSVEGLELGEWPFWLGNQDLNRNFTLVLYGLADHLTTQMPVEGAASILPLNISRTAESAYDVTGIKVGPGEQIFSDRGSLPQEKSISNISEAEARVIVEWYDDCEVNSTCPTNAHLQAFAFARAASYVNGMVTLDGSAILNSIKLSNSAWRFNPNLFETNGTIRINGTTFKDTVHFSGIEYAGSTYVTFGFGPFASLGQVAYCRSDGLLLYITMGSYGDLYSSLPSVITRAFGLIPGMGARFSGTGIALVLLGATNSVSRTASSNTASGIGEQG
ncbi:MAG: hypothetical protein JRM99_06750 [Nitrososphaerota archaeon]|nr:hypothetical protein [Nitrososphaerota archaeon]